MTEKIISVDYETKENMKKNIEQIDYIWGETDENCFNDIFKEVLESLEEIKKRMRVFVKSKIDSKTFSIRVNSEDSMETVQNKLKRIELKIKEYKGDKTESI